MAEARKKGSIINISSMAGTWVFRPCLVLGISSVSITWVFRPWNLSDQICGQMRFVVKQLWLCTSSEAQVLLGWVEVQAHPIVGCSFADDHASLRLLCLESLCVCRYARMNENVNMHA